MGKMRLPYIPQLGNKMSLAKRANAIAFGSSFGGSDVADHNNFTVPHAKLFFFISIPINTVFRSFLTDLVGTDNIYTYNQYLETYLQ